MMRKLLVAFGLALAVTLLPSAAFAHAGHDHGTKAKKVKKPKPKEAHGGVCRAAVAALLNQNGPVPLTTIDGGHLKRDNSHTALPGMQPDHATGGGGAG